MQNIKKFYITFGNDTTFPFQNTYIIIEANNETEMQDVYQILYPDKNTNCLNYSFAYTQTEWDNGVYRHYTQPEVIIHYNLVKSLLDYHNSLKVK